MAFCRIDPVKQNRKGKHMRKKNLVITIVLSAILVFAFSASAFGAAYNDVSGHWAESEINEWSQFGIIQGFDGNFRPDDSITRGEMATIIQRIMYYKTAAANSFSDLPAEEWYTEPMLKLNAAGVMLGDGAGHANPQNTITRQEALVMLARALGLNSWPANSSLTFIDSDDVSYWAVHDIAVMAERDYLDWAGDYIIPKQAITRAEIIATIDNIITQVWEYSGLYCENVSGCALLRADRVYLQNCFVYGNVIVPGSVSSAVLEHCRQTSVVSADSANTHVMDYNDGQVVPHVYYGTAIMPLRPGCDHNRYMANYFSRDGKDRVLYNEPGVRMRSGIDVSEHQSQIDWAKVAGDGLDFAIIRLGYRGYSYGSVKLDARYTENMKNAAANGLDVGVYFFSQAITVEEAIEEAEFCIENLRGYNITGPVVFDWETVGSAEARTNNMDGTVLSDCCVAFCRAVEAAGYDAMVYSYKDLTLRKLQMEKLEPYQFWFAGYTTYPEFVYDFEMWQYTSSGSVSGIEGRVDMDVWFIR